jgi:hypothetical protein
MSVSGRRSPAGDAALDDWRELGVAGPYHLLAVDAGECGVGCDLGHQALHGGAVGCRGPYLDHRVDEGEQLLAGVPDVDGHVEPRQHVDHHGVEGQLPLVAPAPVDGRFGHPGAGGDRFHGQ